MMTRERELDLLCGMARRYQANTGRQPTTMKELADHWYDMSDDLVVVDPPMTLAEVDHHHMGQCSWLRRLEKRADADAMLAEARRFAD